MKLGEALVKEGLVTRQQLELALQRQVQFGGRIGTNLVELRVLGEDELIKFLSKYFRVPAVSLEMIAGIDEETLGSISPEMVDKYKILPFRKERNRLHAAVLNPRDIKELDELRFITGLDIVPYVITELRLLYALEKYYGMKRELRFISLSDRFNPDAKVEKEPVDKIKIAFSEVKETEEIAGILLQAAYKVAARVAIFIMKGGAIVGWKGRGLSMDDFMISENALKEEEFSIFSDVLNRRSYYRGPVLNVKGNGPLIKILSGTPQDALLMPVNIREKVIALLYVDNGNNSVLNANVGYLSKLVSMAGIAFEIMLLKKRILDQ
ncbi:MAG TPA: hypothetical protein VN328_13285 [Thermodesulfovibrionales bacterium]|nr:hypothetical protein [Thermodesulfovibrionales bacterium]